MTGARADRSGPDRGAVRTVVTRQDRSHRFRALARNLVVGGLLVAAGGTATTQPRLPGRELTAVRPLDLQLADRLVNDLRRQGALQPAAITVDPIVAGRYHQRFTRFHRGVPLIGGDLRVQTDGRKTISVFGRLPDVQHLDVRPTLSAADAAAAAPGDPTSTPPALVIAPDAAGEPRLAYLVTTVGAQGPVAHVVDARTGSVRLLEPGIRTQGPFPTCVDCAVGEGHGVKGDRKKMSVRVARGAFTADDGLRPSRIATYDMAGDWNRTLDVLLHGAPLLARDLALDADNDWRDGASVDAHTGTGWALDYLFHRFGRQGLDDGNRPVVVLVHPVRRADFFSVPEDVARLFHLNAFFCRTCGSGGMLVFGEGLPPGQSLGGTAQTVDFFAAGLDIVAHELGHAVIDFTSRLIYQGESGALSEAFADLLGVGTEFFVAESRRHPAEVADYLVGEDVVRPGGIRSLANPGALGDPDHYALRFRGAEDNGGVHTNSTIVSHVFYLAIEGGTHRTSHQVVPGLGPDARGLVEQIFHRALTLLVPRDATFSMARAATLQSARDLTPDPTVEHTLAAAWTAVGVE